jgi:nucleoside-diphosphate-sugar epimerase
MKILITGITGFVGNNLSNFLKQKGIDITGVSRYNEQSSDNIIIWDELFQRSVKDEYFDAYIHLAGKAHDLKNVADPAEYIRVNTALTKNIFDRFLKSSAQDFIYFSSVKAAADEIAGILTEEIKENPQTAYGQSKYQAEIYLLAQKLPPEKRIIIFRPCMIHGPGNKGNLNLLYNFVRKGIPYPLAAYDNKRSFLSIDNLCYAVYLVLNDKTVGSGVYNLADDATLSTNELVTLISGTLERKPRLLSVPKQILHLMARVGDFIKLPLNSERLKKLTENYIVSNEKLKKSLKISQFPVTAYDGLVKTIQSFDKE